LLWEPDIKLIKINHQAKSKLTQHKKIKLKKKVMGTKIKGEKKKREVLYESTILSLDLPWKLNVVRFLLISSKVYKIIKWTKTNN